MILAFVQEFLNAPCVNRDGDGLGDGEAGPRVEDVSLSFEEHAQRRWGERIGPVIEGIEDVDPVGIAEQGGVMVVDVVVDGLKITEVVRWHVAVGCDLLKCEAQ